MRDSPPSTRIQPRPRRRRTAVTNALGNCGLRGDDDACKAALGQFRCGEAAPQSFRTLCPQRRRRETRLSRVTVASLVPR